ncbi:hypothetical protein P4V72_20455 [Bacillus thuringiensis]|uniref:Uncharacterized protein n=1 Tax=Bacillus thuringiensis TaxID=1428 RepID=A0A9W3XGU4_BACTU|nr:hypothetical protein [Bacillus thuringiensis]AQY37003.1 hypothetical protein B4918_02830 [Bacillus thuringiensis]MDR4148767.1 hypothetical protein [Bacillus thuringiensis]MEC3570988.1 hypothetical protein [Bacillus thuringiensis]MED2018530.1 hypothetical protein [Bacillus thuringiensis]MED2143524.1 hypothetical protein [Bacillus thuringiensis]
MFNTKEAELYKRITELEKDLAVEQAIQKEFRTNCQTRQEFLAKQINKLNTDKNVQKDESEVMN